MAFFEEDFFGSKLGRLLQVPGFLSPCLFFFFFGKDVEEELIDLLTLLCFAGYTPTFGSARGRSSRPAWVFFWGDVDGWIDGRCFFGLRVKQGSRVLFSLACGFITVPSRFFGFIRWSRTHKGVFACVVFLLGGWTDFSFERHSGAMKIIFTAESLLFFPSCCGRDM